MQFPKRDHRNPNAAPHAVPVVNPNGLIKLIQVNHTQNTPVLDRELVEDPATGAVHVESVRVSQAFERAGWCLLEDLYRLDNGPEGEGEARWQDYLDHLAYAAKCERQSIRPAPFPSDLLPDEVLARRRGERPMGAKWAPRSKPKAAKPAKAKPAEVA